MTDYDPEYVCIEIDGRSVLMRREDLSLNAIHIMKIAGKNANQCKHLLQVIRKYVKTISSSWVSLRTGQLLCKYLEVEEKLQPLLDYGCRLQSDDHQKMSDWVDDDLAGLQNRLLNYVEIGNGRMLVVVRKSDLRINCTQILHVAGLDRRKAVDIRQTTSGDAFDTVSGRNIARRHQGTYVDFQIGIDLCRRHGLVELEKELQVLKSNSEELAPRPTSFKNETLNRRWSPVRELSQQEPALLQLSTESRRVEHMIEEDQIRAEYTDSGADIEGSVSSVKSHDNASIEEYVQPQEKRHSHDAESSLPPLSIWEYQSHRSCLRQVNLDLGMDSRNLSSQYGSFKTDVDDVWKNLESLE